jgi:hypothetical protein
MRALGHISAFFFSCTARPRALHPPRQGLIPLNPQPIRPSGFPEDSRSATKSPRHLPTWDRCLSGGTQKLDIFAIRYNQYLLTRSLLPNEHSPLTQKRKQKARNAFPVLQPPTIKPRTNT